MNTIEQKIADKIATLTCERDAARADVERLRGNIETMQVNADWCAVELPRLQTRVRELVEVLEEALGSACEASDEEWVDCEPWHHKARAIIARDDPSERRPL